MPRLVRRAPLKDRIQAYLNPYDFMLWLSEEFETRDWDENVLANPVALTFNFAFLVARANSTRRNRAEDDVFGDSNNGTGWFGWFCSILATVLTITSLGNAAYVFMRKRHYRLFENSVDRIPGTPSAQRVRVDATPASASPLRFLKDVISGESAESRSHPDPTRDVWEIAVWDPIPICMRLFCLFSPGHVLVYYLFLPLTPLDPRPSTTVATLIVLEILLSVQLLVFQSSYAQQIKDTAIIKKEVLNEYDTKFVHPRLQPRPSRDVGTQFASSAIQTDMEVDNEVEVFKPITILRRSFKTNPNPNYAKHVSPENPELVPKRDNEVLNPFTTPIHNQYRGEPTPLRTAVSNMRQPDFRPSSSTGISSGRSSINNYASPAPRNDGGSLGVYTHNKSPLKKATSMYDLEKTRHSTPTNSLQAAAREVSENRETDRRRSEVARRSVSPAKKPLDDSARRATGAGSYFITKPKGESRYY